MEIKNKENYTITTTCRTCASNYETDNLIPIFCNNNKIKPIDIIDTFSTTQFKLSQNDYMPQNICKTCLKNFTILKEFITECEKAEIVLKNYFERVESLKTKYRIINKNNSINKKIFAIKECRVRLKRIKTERKISIKYENHTNTSLFHNEVSESISKIEINDNSFDILTEKVMKNEDFSNSSDSWDGGRTDALKSVLSSDDEETERFIKELKETKRNEIFKSIKRNENYNKFNRIQCEICPVIFCEMNYLKHMKKHQPLILSECSICKKLVEDLKVHELKKHKIKYVCSDCDETFDNRRKYRTHRIKKHEKPEHSCKFCDKSYIFLCRLKEHEKVCHTSDANAICDICGKIFKNPNLLASHRATHIIERKINKNDIDSKQMSSEVNTFKCPYCSLKFRNLFGLTNHSKHHKKLKHSETYRHVCEFCNQRFNRSDHLQLHLDLVHLKNFPFTCKYCSKKFVKQYILNQHIRRRHEATSHICQYCKKNYSFRVSLTRHIRSHHLMEKRFKCDICGEAFITGIQCKKHMEIHTIQEERETAKRIYGEILNGPE